MASLVVARLSEFLFHEAEVLSTVESRVEDIRRELMLMKAFLKDIESGGEVQVEGFNKLMVDFNDVARDIDDAVETFLDISVRTTWNFSLVDRYKVGKEVERISERVREISKRMKLIHASGEAVETSRNATEEEAPAVEKLSYILREKLVADFEVKSVVEEVRDEVAGMENVVSDLKSKEQSNEREKVWLEEASNVSNFTVSVIEDFITRRRKSEGFPLLLGMLMRHLLAPLNWLIRFLTLPYWPFPSEEKLMKEMKYIKTQVQGALIRRLTYGVGEEDVGDQQIGSTPIIQITPLLSPLSLIEFYTLPIIVSMSTSPDQKLEPIQRELALMHAFFIDIRGVEGLNERQKVWVEQMKDTAQQAEALLAAYELRVNNGGFNRLFFQCIVAPLQFDKGINYILYKMRNNWERKTIYDIANIEGRQGLVPLGQTVQGTGCEIQIVVEHNDNSGAAEDPLLPAGMSNNYQPRTVELLQEDLQLMNALFHDANEMGELDGRSKIWVDQMKDIASQIESVSNDSAGNIPHLIIHWKINQIRNKIQEASRIRKRYGLIHLQTQAVSSSVVQRLRGRTQPPLDVRESNIIGFDEDVQVLMGKLLSDEKNRCIISIIGIEGIGKTTLARLIFDNVAIQDHFDYRVWVSARQDPVELLVKDKDKQIMSDPEATQTGKEDSTQMLKNFLKKKGCLILIVVDDVQTPVVWDTLKKTIPDMSTGCRLLLTSRNTKVEELHSGPRTFMHQLLLDDENSWVLFKRKLKVETPSKLIEVGKKFAIKCGGLPSEILKIGDELSKKDVTDKEWSSMLQELNPSQIPWSETLNTIENDLPLYLMRCLSYFMLFPAEFEIPTRRLIVLWVAEGLVHHGQDQDSPEQVAERCLAELIDLNMIQIAKRKRNGKVKTCRLPNALRESRFLQTRLSINSDSVSNEAITHQGAGHLSTNSDSVQKKPLIRQVADRLDKKDICFNHIHSDTITASASQKSLYKDVLSFLSFDTREGDKPGQEIGKFLNRCISRGCFLQLRVLDLERVYKPQFPENIARLSRLRYLGLRWTYLESLPSSISSLLKLQTLDLKHTYISELPSSIWKIQLRHLFLSETYRSRFPRHPKGNSLSDLQTLWGLSVDEKTPVKGGLDRSINIRKLGLACQSMSLCEEGITKQLHAVAEWIMKLEYLQSLRLQSRKENGQPGDLHLGSLKTHADLTDMYLLGILKSPSMKSLFPPTLIELTLSHSNLQKDSIEILGDLPLLQSLCLLAGSYIEETLHCKKGSFPQLYVLKFWNLKELKKWNIEEEAFLQLRQMEIRSCECLQMLPDGLRHISTLRELKLTTMSDKFIERVDKYKIPESCNALNCYIIPGERKFTCKRLF